MSKERMILITKKECKKCEYVKSKIPEGMDILMLDAETKEGMSYLALAESIGKPMPILLKENGKFEPDKVEGAINIKNAILDAWKNNG